MFFFMANNYEESSKCARLYMAHKDAMYRRAYKILHNEKDAEDAVHDSFERILKYNYLYKIDENNFAYTRNLPGMICSNVAKDYLKQIKRINMFEMEDSEFENLGSEYLNPENIAIGNETKDRIKDIINKLPEIYRDSFLMKKVYDMSVSQISGITGEKEETIRKRVLRAQEKIKIAFKKEADCEKI